MHTCMNARTGDRPVRLSRRSSMRSFCSGQPNRLTQIIRKPPERFAPFGLFRHSQNRRRMDRREPGASVRPMQQNSALARQNHGSPHQSKRRGRAEGHDETRLQNLEFTVEPPATGDDLLAVRPLVQSSLAAWLILEVFYRVGDVDLCASPISASARSSCFRRRKVGPRGLRRRPAARRP
jgi:hypothetical protein